MSKAKMYGVISLSVVIGLVMSFSLAVPLSSGGEIEFRLAPRMHIPSLDPINQSSNWEYVVANNIYDSLVYPDPNPKNLCIPWIAESWEVSGDAKTYTFHLRKGLKFHDGSEVTAEDVAFSMDRQQTLGGQVSSYMKAVRPGNSEVVDRYTVAFHLVKPDPSFLASLFIFKVLNKDQILKHKGPGQYGEFGDYGVKWIDTHDAGSGPYKLIKRVHGDRVIFEKFKEYRLREWKPNSFDRIVIYITPEIVTMATRMKKGEVDMCDFRLPAEVIKDLQKTEGVNVQFDGVDNPWYVILNNKKPPLDDINVRKAMAYAFDYETVIKNILLGGTRSQGPVPNRLIGHNDDLMIYRRDIKKAKELIKKSKYSKRQLSEFQLEYASSSGNQNFLNIGLLAAANFKEIGLNVKVREVRWADICQHQAKPETAFHMVIFYQGVKIPHPQQFLVFYTPEGWGTAYPPGGIYYENPEVTKLIEKAKGAPSLEEQSKYYGKAQELIVDDVPSLFLHNDLVTQPLWRYVKGYEMPTGAFFYQFRFDKYWMDTSDEFYRRNHARK